MGYKRPNVVDSGLGLPAKARAGDGWLANPSVSIEADDSAQNIPVSAILGGIYVRDGMTAGRSDTTPAAADLIAALDGMDIGEGHIFAISVTTAFVLTLLAGAGVTLVGKTTVPASGMGWFLLTKTSATTVSIRGL